jgi:hypothetical protein
MSARDREDLITLILIRWQFSRLVEWMALMNVLLNRREGCDLEETYFSDSTEIDCGHRTVSFRCFCNELFTNVSRISSTTTDTSEKVYYTNLIRGCFLVALVYDLRVQRFVMTQHDFHSKTLRSVPPERHKTNHFIETVMPWINDFLKRSLSMDLMTTRCVFLWSTNYLFQSDQSFFSARTRNHRETDLTELGF